MSYESLRRMILDCVTMDSVPEDPRIEPYMDRLKRGEPAGRVIRDFMKATLDRKKIWTIRLRGKAYRVIMNSKFIGHVSRPYEGHTVDTNKDLLVVVRRILQCVAGLEHVLLEGRASDLIDDDKHISKSTKKEAHPNHKWIYFEDECEGTVNGRVMVQVAIPPESKGKWAQPNSLYHILPEGSLKFPERHSALEEKEVPRGTIIVEMN